jgi:hypothetical protein
MCNNVWILCSIGLFLVGFYGCGGEDVQKPRSEAELKKAQEAMKAGQSAEAAAQKSVGKPK